MCGGNALNLSKNKKSLKKMNKMNIPKNQNNQTVKKSNDEGLNMKKLKKKVVIRSSIETPNQILNDL